MAILGMIFSLLGRFAGRVANTTLGWATLLLFGQVEASRQAILSGLALGSLIWVVAAVGALVPNVGSILLTAVPIPPFIDPEWVRLALIAAALLLPLGIGAAAIFVVPPPERPHGAGMVVALVRGYPFALVLALTVAILAVVASVRWAVAVRRHWQATHVPMVVQPGGYDALVAKLHDALGRADIETRERPAPAVLSVPGRIVGAVSGRGIGALVPQHLAELSGESLSVLVYPSDVAISGAKDRLARARAAIITQLTDAPAYMTTAVEAQAVEDAIREVASERDGSAAATRRRFAAIDQRLAKLVVPFEQWETLYRERLQLERTILDGREAEPGASLPDPRRAGEPSPRWSAIEVVLIAAVALDLVLTAVAGRIGRRGP